MRESFYTLQLLAVIPRHSGVRMAGYFQRVPLQRGEIFERTGAVQLAGRNQAHVGGAYASAVLGLIVGSTSPRLAGGALVNAVA